MLPQRKRGKNSGSSSVINLSCVIILLQICLACQEIGDGVCFHINSQKQDDQLQSRDMRKCAQDVRKSAGCLKGRDDDNGMQFHIHEMHFLLDSDGYLA